MQSIKTILTITGLVLLVFFLALGIMMGMFSGGSIMSFIFR